MKNSIKVLIVVVSLFVFVSVSVGAYYQSGWYGCKKWTCGRYNDAGARIGYHFNGKHIQIRGPFQYRTIQIKNWYGKVGYYRAVMGRSYNLNHVDLWVRMSEWEPVGGH